MESTAENSGSLPVPQPENSFIESPVEKLWRERVSNMQFYHGTSEIIAAEIQKVGLSPQMKPYHQIDHAYLIQILRQLDLDVGYAEGKEMRSYITSSLSSACGYAIDGPEMMRLFYLNNCDAILSAREKGIAQRAGLTPADIERVKKIKSETIEFLVKHRPALVKIKKDSTVLNQLLQETLKEDYPLLQDREAFKRKVQEIVVQNSGKLTEEEAADLLSRSLTLGELKITSTIPPQELEVITGDQFYSLTPATRDAGEIINTCLYDNERRPAELIHALENFIIYDSGNLDSIVGLCKYYSISEEQGREIFKRAEIMKSSRVNP